MMGCVQIGMLSEGILEWQLLNLILRCHGKESSVIVLLFLAAAIYLALNNHEGVAIALIGIIATLAAIFYLKK